MSRCLDIFSSSQVRPSQSHGNVQSLVSVSLNHFSSAGVGSIGTTRCHLVGLRDFARLSDLFTCVRRVPDTRPVKLLSSNPSAPSGAKNHTSRPPSPPAPSTR